MLASLEHCRSACWSRSRRRCWSSPRSSILFAGVVARYGLHQPLIWSDELASILFLWLAMLGAAVAFRRAEHMRMTAIVASARPAMRAFLDAGRDLRGAGVPAADRLAGLRIRLRGKLHHHAGAADLQHLARGGAAGRHLPDGAVRAAAAGASSAISATVLAAILSVARRDRGCSGWRSRWLRPLGNLNLVIFFVGVAGFCVFAGVPIAFGFGLATFGYLALTTHTPLMVLVGRMDEGMSHLILLSVPLFVFLGLLIEMTGMARAMVGFLASLLGHVRGGLHYVLVGAMYLVSGISGSKAADMAAVAPVLFPEMKQRGAKPGDLVALLSATGAQTETIPPSLVLITIGSVTGVSIAALFTGGLLPGVVLAITLCVAGVVALPQRGPAATSREPAAARSCARFVIALPALALPFVIRAAVVEGIATATEVSTIGIVYASSSALIFGLLIYRNFDWRRLVPMLVETACLSGAILLIIGTRDRHGLGPDAVRLLARAGGGHDRPARRRGDLHRGIDRRLHHPRQRARRHPGDRAVRAAAVSDRAGSRRARGALCDGRHPRDGHRPVRAAVRRRLLRRLRHRPRRSGRRHQADPRLSCWRCWSA